MQNRWNLSNFSTKQKPGLQVEKFLISLEIKEMYSKLTNMSMIMILKPSEFT